MKTETMVAAVQEAPERLVVKAVPVPEIKAHEVLIRVKYTGICGTDWSIYTGLYSVDRLPLIPGHEFSGVVALTGKNVRELKEGDRVTADINMSCGHCFYCRRGQKLMCPEFTQLGIHTDGTYAEYVKAPAELVHRRPDNIDFMTGAFIEPVSCVIHSAKALDVKLGSSVAIIGSGLGILHAAVSVHKGAAPVIVIGRNKKRLAAARQMGADITMPGKRMPLVIMLLAVGFNLVNGSLLGWQLARRGNYTLPWLTDPRFVAGLVLFLGGMAANWWADRRLINLRRPGELGYVIPRGGLFEVVSCPNHLGEIVEWSGFALMTWSLPGLAFAFWTAANLVPRSLAHHRWYRQTFPEYPEHRRAILPGLL